MPIAEPTGSELWDAVRPRTEWPDTDETKMEALGNSWKNAGAGFLNVGSDVDPPGYVNPAWSDSAGIDFQDVHRILRRKTHNTGTDMKHLSWLADEFAFDVAYTKSNIVGLVREGDAVYASLYDLVFLPDYEQRERLVIEIANKINGFLDHMAARIAARGAHKAEVPLPDALGLPESFRDPENSGTSVDIPDRGRRGAPSGKTGPGEQPNQDRGPRDRGPDVEIGGNQDTGVAGSDRTGFEGTGYAREELVEVVYQHSGEGDQEIGGSEPRPSADRIAQAIENGERKERDQANGKAIVYEDAEVRVIINQNEPLRSTAYYK